MIGQLFKTLDAIGKAKDTAIIFTSDHGEMLGERGMWFKKHFYERALQVPLLMKLPGQTPMRVSTPASLVDLLPTFMGIATGDAWHSEVENLEGHDLTQTVGAAPEPDRPVFAEYLAEATPTPILMIRKGTYKFIYSRIDPVLLFDLANDPNERNNIANDPSQLDRVVEFEKLVAKKWNIDTLTADIVESQKRRRLIVEGYKNGVKPRWNHAEEATDEVIWYRGEGGYNEWAFSFLPVKIGAS
jgi:choline-sulfatase